MIVERIREMNRKDIFLKIVLPAIVIALLIFYFKAFFTEGAYFNNTFLVKSVVGNERRYIGKSKQGDIYITVKGLEDTHENMEVIYRLPGNINRQYTVMLDHENKWYASIKKL